MKYKAAHRMRPRSHYYTKSIGWCLVINIYTLTKSQVFLVSRSEIAVLWGSDQSKDFARFFENLVCVVSIFGLMITFITKSSITCESTYIWLHFSKKDHFPRSKACAKTDSLKNAKNRQKMNFYSLKNAKNRQKIAKIGTLKSFQR